MLSAQSSPIEIVRAYHDHWRSGEFDRAAGLLAETVEIETPINTYASKADFVSALASFGTMVVDVKNFVEAASGANVVQVYDMYVQGLGMIRIAEHFAVENGKIAHLRQIHDTVALRAAGFDRQSGVVR